MASDQSRFRAAQRAAHAMIVRATTCAVVLILASAALLLQPQAAVAQQAPPSDLSGSWISPSTDNVLERDEGPFTDDWTGMPLNAAGRALAQSYSAGMLAEPERVCQLYGQFHYANGVFNLRITPVTGGSTDKIVAWTLQKVEDIGGMTIWMDGRSPPSKYSDHGRGAFTTGHWKGDTLVAYTTDMKRAPARDNGAFSSDQATLTSTFIPHGDVLVVVSVLNDPVYMSQPYVYSRAYMRSTRPVSTAWAPCVVNFEGTNEGDVPFFLPGKDPLLDQMMQLFHVPAYASEGGADTMYPAYRDRLKAQYLKLYPTFPKKCTQYCTNFRFMQPVGNLAQPPAKPARGKAKSAP